MPSQRSLPLGLGGLILQLTNTVGALRAQPVATLTHTSVAPLAGNATSWPAHLGVSLAHPSPSLWGNMAQGPGHFWALAFPPSLSSSPSSPGIAPQEAQPYLLYLVQLAQIQGTEWAKESAPEV